MTASTDLRDRLMVAFHGGDQQGFIELCRRHAETIVRDFNSWAVAPAEIRHDQQAINDYLHALVAIAQLLEALGHSGPMERLNPAGQANPINRWLYAFSRAQRLSDAGEYAASSTELHSILTSMRGAAGSGVEEIQTKVAGLLGANAMRLGRLDEAISYTEEALSRCRAVGDFEGVWIYTENLDTLVVAKQTAAGTAAGRDLKHARDQLTFAQDLSDARRFPASNEVLHELLGAVADTAGSRYLGKIYGLLGLNYFQLNDLPEAERCTQRALAECHARQDYLGEKIYSANLTEIRRNQGASPDQATR